MVAERGLALRSFPGSIATLETLAIAKPMAEAKSGPSADPVIIFHDARGRLYLMGPYGVSARHGSSSLTSRVRP